MGTRPVDPSPSRWLKICLRSLVADRQRRCRRLDFSRGPKSNPRRQPAFSVALILALTLSLAIQLLALVHCDASDTAPSGWTQVEVPSAWKKPPGQKNTEANGFHWYRAWVHVPEAWKGRRLQLFVESMDDVRQTFFNGAVVGVSGSFPPRYRSGLGEGGRIELTPDRVIFGGDNLIALRTYFRDGRTNFSVAAPVLAAASGEAIRMRGSWQYRRGDDPAWAAPAATPPPQDLIFRRVDAVEDLELYVRRREGDHDALPPSEALKKFHVDEGLEIELVLSEPEIAQPLYMQFDGRGRLWVLEYRQYPNPAGLKVLSRDKYLRTVFDRLPRPPPHDTPGTDRISIHADRDGDGLYETHRVFVDRLNIASSFALGSGGVWILNPPYLLFYADADANDIPDGDPEVLLEGFGLEDTHSVVNSLRWGPDGWLYGAQGSTVTGRVRRPGSEEKPLHTMGQLIWRYHPELRRYEVFAEGGGNTFGVEIDRKGRLFSGTNGGNARGFHYVQGGYYRKTFAKHGAHSNPYTFGFFEDMEHEDVQRFTHTFVIYDGDALPSAYGGRLFGVEPLQGRVVMSRVEAIGSSFRTSDIGYAVRSDDQWFRPVAIAAGPDGALYVADFHEQRIDHSSHFAGRVRTDTGRIYRLAPRGLRRPSAFNLGQRSTNELLALLDHANQWFRDAARREFVARKDPGTATVAREQLQRLDGQAALERLWVAHLLTPFVDAETLDFLGRHDDPHVRLWLIRLACDDGHVSPALSQRLVELAADETHPEVRSQLAASARRLPVDDCLAIVRALLKRTAVQDDLHVPLLLWWAIEAQAGHREELVAFFSRGDLWNLESARSHLAPRLLRRYALSGSRQDLLACARLLGSASAVGPVVTTPLLEGFELAFAGRSMSGLPPELIDAIAACGGGSLALRVRSGNPAAAIEALQVIEREDADAAERERLIEVLSETRHAAARAPLLRLVEESSSPSVRTAALSALGAYTDIEIGPRVVDLFMDFSSDERRAAEVLLLSRTTWTQHLVDAIDDRSIAPSSVSRGTVERLAAQNDPTMTAFVRRHWGEASAEAAHAARSQIVRTRAILAAAAGNPYRGKVLYGQTCGKCHELFGEGRDVGPDLTAHDRNDLERLLESVVRPSAEIREGYENYLAVTHDGRILSGFIVERSERSVTLRTVDGKNHVLERRSLAEFRALEQSIMPEGALDGLSDQDIRDLFAYLRSTQPLP